MKIGARNKAANALVSIRERGQLTIPNGIRKAAHLEVGDAVEISITLEGILLRPRKFIDSTQAWFWTPKWQRMERGASEDIRLGNVRTFKTEKDFLAELK